MILVIDNQDSFTWNLVQYLRELGPEVQVVRSDALAWHDVRELRPAGILLGPGPGGPQDAGCSLEVARELAGSVPILGICLGMQVIAEAHGARIRREEPVHGHTCEVLHDGRGVFAGLPSPLSVGRYHSLVVEPCDLPEELVVSAHTRDGVPMGLRHRRLALEGVQFHPESILSTHGHELLANFLGTTE